MVLDLKSVYEGNDESIDFDYDVDPERLQEIKGYFFKSFHVSGKAYSSNAGIAVLSYVSDFVLNASCDRCLSLFEKEIKTDFRYILVKSLNEDSDNDEYIVTEGDSLDLDEIVISDGLLQIPMKLLCKEDCKGLCMYCGANLNYGNCGCKAEKAT